MGIDGEQKFPRIAETQAGCALQDQTGLGRIRRAIGSIPAASTTFNDPPVAHCREGRKQVQMGRRDCGFAVSSQLLAQRFLARGVLRRKELRRSPTPRTPGELALVFPLIFLIVFLEAALVAGPTALVAGPTALIAGLTALIAALVTLATALPAPAATSLLPLHGAHAPLPSCQAFGLRTEFTRAIETKQRILLARLSLRTRPPTWEEGSPKGDSLPLGCSRPSLKCAVMDSVLP